MRKLVEKIKENWENSVLFRAQAVTFGITFVSYVLAIICCVLAINAPLEVITKLFSTLMDIFCGLGLGTMFWFTILELIGTWLHYKNN